MLFWIAFPNSLDMSKASVIQLVLMSVVGIFIGLITAIGEEIGWRGYLVPATLERVGIKKALIYTSIFWGVCTCLFLYQVCICRELPHGILFRLFFL